MNGNSKKQNEKNENVEAFFLLNKSTLKPQNCLKPLTVQLHIYHKLFVHQGSTKLYTPLMLLANAPCS